MMPKPAPRLKTLDDCLQNFNEQQNIRGSINLRMRDQMPHRPNMPNMPLHHGKGKWYDRLLHRTRDFIRNGNKKRYKMPPGGKPGPSFYLYNKNNYLRLKEGLGKKIYNEFLKDTKEEDKEMKKTLLSQLVAEPGTSKRFNNNLNIGSTLLRNGGGINKPTHVLKTKLKGKEKSYDNRDMAKKREMINNDNKLRGPRSHEKNRRNEDSGSFSFFSDGLKFFNDFFGGDDDKDNKNDKDDDFFNFGFNTSSSSSKNNNPFSNFGYGGYNYGSYGYNNNGFGYNNYGYNYN